jgi:hypothetical protein
MGLVINTVDHTWYYQMCPEETYHFENEEDAGNTVTTMRMIGGLSQLAALQILTEGDRNKLNEFLVLELPLFERVSGLTNIIEHVIDTGDNKPVKKGYYFNKFILVGLNLSGK